MVVLFDVGYNWKLFFSVSMKRQKVNISYRKQEIWWAQEWKTKFRLAPWWSFSFNEFAEFLQQNCVRNDTKLYPQLRDTYRNCCEGKKFSSWNRIRFSCTKSIMSMVFCVIVPELQVKKHDWPFHCAHKEEMKTAWLEMFEQNTRNLVPEKLKIKKLNSTIFALLLWREKLKHSCSIVGVTFRWYAALLQHPLLWEFMATLHHTRSERAKNPGFCLLQNVLTLRGSISWFSGNNKSENTTAVENCAQLKFSSCPAPCELVKFWDEFLLIQIHAPFGQDLNTGLSSAANIWRLSVSFLVKIIRHPESLCQRCTLQDRFPLALDSSRGRTALWWPPLVLAGSALPGSQTAETMRKVLWQPSSPDCNPTVFEVVIFKPFCLISKTESFRKSVLSSVLDVSQMISVKCKKMNSCLADILPLIVPGSIPTIRADHNMRVRVMRWREN